MAAVGRPRDVADIGEDPSRSGGADTEQVHQCEPRAVTAARSSFLTQQSTLPPTRHATSNPAQSSGNGGAEVYYENCDAVRAAGAAPIHRSDPGYGSHLDRDGDGSACE